MNTVVFSLLNALQPRFGLRTVRNLTYGGHERGAMDVHAPRRGLDLPVVVFFYGGGWDSGARADFAWAGAALAALGCVTIVPDYRLHPHVRWPDFLEDCAKATAKAREVATEFGGDPQRLVLMGHSAGAYNAGMLAMDERWLGAEGMDPRRDLAGWIGLAGPYDFLPLRTDKLKTIFGPPEQHPATQPISHVRGGDPPALLMTGQDDTVVRPSNSERLAGRLVETGGEAKLVVYPGVDHLRIMGAMAAPLRFLAPVLGEVSAFIDSTARRAGKAPPGREA